MFTCFFPLFEVHFFGTYAIGIGTVRIAQMNAPFVIHTTGSHMLRTNTAPITSCSIAVTLLVSD